MVEHKHLSAFIYSLQFVAAALGYLSDPIQLDICPFLGSNRNEFDIFPLI